VLPLLACEHSTPFDPPSHGQDGPLTGGDPVRLTYGSNAQPPAWTPDGESILFSFTDASRPDDDRCVAQMPRTGGSIVRLICHAGVLTTDSLDRLEQPALNEAGRLAFVRSSRRLGSITDRERWLSTLSWADPATVDRVRSIPFQVAGGLRTSIASLEWLDDARVAFIANAEAIVLPCEVCDPIVVESGRELLVLDPTVGGEFLVVPVPGNATSVSGTPDELFYTLAGDTRVYRGSLAGGASVVHDFGAAGIARSVHVAGNRLVVLVGGLIRDYDDPAGVVQTDEGGALWVMDLPNGTPAPILSQTQLFREPALSPDGAAIVAIAVPITVEAIIVEGEPVGLDTTISGPPDLWRLGE
jgi:hypothetical protein